MKPNFFSKGVNDISHNLDGFSWHPEILSKARSQPFAFKDFFNFKHSSLVSKSYYLHARDMSRIIFSLDHYIVATLADEFRPAV